MSSSFRSDKRYKRVKLDHPTIEYYQVCIEYPISYEYDMEVAVRVKLKNSRKLIERSFIKVRGLITDFEIRGKIDYSSDVSKYVDVLITSAGEVVDAVIKNTVGFEFPVEVRRLSNDLYFETSGNSIPYPYYRYELEVKSSGYNDSYWWNNVAPIGFTVMKNGIIAKLDYINRKITYSMVKENKHDIQYIC